MTTPTNRLLTRAAGQTVSGSISDPEITTATLYLNGGIGETIVVDPDGNFSKVVTLSSGANTIEVRATDTAGNAGTSGVVNVTLDSTSPQLVIGLSDPEKSITITVTSNEALTSLPTASVNATSVDMTQVDVNKWRGVYGSDASPIAAANYAVSVTGVDKAGNTETRTASFSKKTINVDGVNPTTVTAPDATLQIETHGAVNNMDISLTHSLENPSGNVENPAAAAAGAFVNIVVPAELRDNLKQIYIQINYDPDDLPAGTDESTLRLYLWDTATGTWEVVPGSGVNTEENYIYGTATHLSEYGGFGSITAAAAEVTEGGGVGYGGAPGYTLVYDIVTTSGRFTKAVQASSSDRACLLSIPKDTTGLQSNGRPLNYIKITKSTAPPAAPADGAKVSYVYDLEPDGTTFDPPVNLTIKYDEDNIPEGIVENNLVIAIWDETDEEWVALDSTVDSGDNTITAPVGHFTNFAVLAYTRPAAFTVSELSISPSEVIPGEKVNISVSVTNTGDLTDSYELDLRIDDKIEETREVTLAGGETEELTFTVARDKSGSYTVSLDGLTGKFVVKAPSAFAVSDLSITPAEVEIGETVTIGASVTNTGDISGSYEVTLKINDAVVEVKKVTLASSASEKLAFTVARDKPGSYIVNIDGLSGEFMVRALPPAPAPTPPTPPPPPPTPPVKKVNWWLIGGAIAGALIIVTVVVLVIRRRE